MFYNTINCKNKLHLFNQDIILLNKYKLFLENINLTISNFNCLIKGHNGSGKSLLIKYYINILNIPLQIVIRNYLFYINILYYNFNIFSYKFKHYNKIFKLLSYGNKQLILYKLNLILVNKLLIFDEITNGLDKQNYKIVVKNLILSFLTKKKLLLISHRKLIKSKYTLLYLI